MSYTNYINEIKNSKVIVIYPGRFSPFHSGHRFSYDKLREAFPENDIYLTTSDVEKDAKHPFSYLDKKEIITTMFPDIPEETILNQHYPYDVDAILASLELNPKDTIVVVGIGEKDFDSRFEDDPYWIDFDGMLDYTAKHHAYKYKLPQLQLQIGTEIISGSVIREIMKSDDETKKKRLFKTVYPEWNGKIFKLIDRRINSEKD
jgi:hypothetical protein